MWSKKYKFLYFISSLVGILVHQDLGKNLGTNRTFYELTARSEVQSIVVLKVIVPIVNKRLSRTSFHIEIYIYRFKKMLGNYFNKIDFL